jgi:hypothetical protein
MLQRTLTPVFRHPDRTIGSSHGILGYSSSAWLPIDLGNKKKPQLVFEQTSLLSLIEELQPLRKPALRVEAKDTVEGLPVAAFVYVSSYHTTYEMDRCHLNQSGPAQLCAVPSVRLLMP